MELNLATILLLAWLTVCTVFDLRSRQVPSVFTLPPLALAAAWRLIQGNWQMVLLVLILILVSDIPSAKWRIPIACFVTLGLLATIKSPEMVYSLVVILAVWALWEVGVSGGADAKIIIALVLFFGDGLLFIPIVVVGGIQGAVALVSKKKTIPYTVAIALGTAAWLWLFARA